MLAKGYQKWARRKEDLLSKKIESNKREDTSEVIRRKAKKKQEIKMVCVRPKKPTAK